MSSPLTAVTPTNPTDTGPAPMEDHPEPASPWQTNVYSFEVSDFSAQNSVILEVNSSVDRKLNIMAKQIYHLADNKKVVKVLEFFLTVEDSVDDGDGLGVQLESITVRILNALSAGERFVKKLRPDFDEAKDGWTPLFKLSWQDLMNPGNGYVVDDVLRLELEIKSKRKREVERTEESEMK